MRGHHLICLHFFNGKGYSEEFIKSLRETLENVNRVGFEICKGPDDICRKCPYLENGEICAYDEQSDEEITKMDGFALELLKKTTGTKIKWHDIKEVIPGIFSLWLKRYCKGCSWKGACEENAFYRELRDGKYTL
ncbi:MAG: DUF1284 domain-containing protein [Nitrospirae bacterium]|nr:DUF1284 domain-containing protein [Nitrospirota bacterium]